LINSVHAQARQFTFQCHQEVSCGVGRAEMHLVTALDQPNCAPCSHGRFAHAAFSHDHDQPTPAGCDFIDHAA
jgi:hypothetical protein